MSETKVHSEFPTVATWLKDERSYQTKKFGYSTDDIEHVRQGMGENSWLWQQVLNYVGRVRLFGLDMPQGRQAYFKLIATLVGLAEATIHEYGLPPAPGFSSGNIEEWEPNRRVYVAGPMTGYAEKNFPAFEEMSEKLISLGFIPINPARNEDNLHERWADFMKPDLVDMLYCSAIVTLPGWEKSKGATMEVNLAKELEIPVFHSAEDIIL